MFRLFVHFHHYLYSIILFLHLDFTIHDVTVYGQGDGDVYAKNFECTGEESSLADCPGDIDCCGHQRDIGLTCALACEEGDIRLADGENEMEGRVEVCYNGRWGTVCDDFWDVSDARVACKMAGLPWRGKQLTQLEILMIKSRAGR